MEENVENSVVETEKQDTRSESDLDSLADNVGKSPPSQERPMRDDPNSQKQAETHEIVWNGKKIKASLDELKKWAQMGYDRPQVMQKFNQEKAAWQKKEAEIQQLQQKYQPYTQIDEWALKNPQAWQTLEQMWKQSMQGGLQQQYQQTQGQPQAPQTAIDPNLQRYLGTLEQKISQFEPVIQQVLDREQTAKQQEEDQVLDQEIKTIKDHYKDFDWQSLDENGKSLELKILEHASNIGTSSFRVAARDLLHDELLSRAQAKAKIDVSQGIQQRTKLGVLGESPTPIKGSFGRNPNKSIKDTSYEEIADEIKEMIRQGKVS